MPYHYDNVYHLFVFSVSSSGIRGRERTVSLSFENIAFSYGAQSILKDLSLTASASSITCLLGASGSGKSTLLRLVAGLERLQRGRIVLDGQVLASEGVHPDPENRPVGMMFQESALFPHMTVADNIAFGLIGKSRQERLSTVDEMLDLVGLSGMGKRYPHSLSGGQQQRVALARSLAPRPQVLLMDEPYANIDMGLRRALRDAARHILKANGTTTILVTHDPEEAAEMADTVALLHDGALVQCDSPQRLFDQPANARVASLFGQAQCLRATVVESGYQTPFGIVLAAPSLAIGSECELAFRGAGLMIEPCDSGSAVVVDCRSVMGRVQVALTTPHTTDILRVELVDAVDTNTVVAGQAVRLIAGDTNFFVFET